jgi:cytochrome c oxidase subunit II
MLNPNSPQAQAISNLFILTLVLGTLILLLVTGLVVYFGMRYRSRGGPEEAEPEPVFGHTRLEVGWTAGPLVLVGILFILTINGMNKSDPPATQQPDLHVTGHQWWWEIGYPVGAGQAAPVITTANEIHIPTGKDLLVLVDSADVVHDFWIPQLGRKSDMTPGHPVEMWIRADQPGTYEGACAEYCGAEHAWMLIRAIAQPQAEFDAWLAGQGRASTTPTSGNAARGALLYRQRTCINCHTINGMPGANSRVGPDLTHFASRQTIGTGILENTPANLAKWLKDPQAIKPFIYMPNLHLADDEVQALVDYMETLK